jgi:hypothetical protein
LSYFCLAVEYLLGDVKETGDSFLNNFEQSTNMRYESFGANTDFFAPDCVENPHRNTMNGGEEKISLMREKERKKMAGRFFNKLTKKKFY